MSADNALSVLCVRLVNDKTLWGRLRSDPESVFAEANRSDEERKLFTEGPFDELKKRLGRGTTSFSALIVNPVGWKP